MDSYPRLSRSQFHGWYKGSKGGDYIRLIETEEKKQSNAMYQPFLDSVVNKSHTSHCGEIWAWTGYWLILWITINFLGFENVRVLYF